ncbi:MAG: hypothetical protein HKN76_17315 [Saprospiraceae bacterium]|nr:hypothetical protein [Saprospiraceae bacterium]
MGKIISLLNLLRKKGTESTRTPEGYCPNCWGRAEYGGAFFETAKNHNMDINSTDEQLGWIQEYANKHLSGIELKPEDNMLVCSKCKLTYKPEEI